MAAPFTRVIGSAAPLPVSNIDTDVIIRIERLVGVDLSTIGQYAFEALRYNPDGSPNQSYPFNQAQWADAPILLAGPNFGCGSSREPAVTALMAIGLKVVIAESFGDIFYANCFQNGLLPIRQEVKEMDRLFSAATEGNGPFEVDLERCTISAPDIALTFTIDPLRREGLLAGLDEMGLTLRDLDMIKAWQVDDRVRRRWAWAPTD